MYTSHFGLTEEPFSISPDPRYLYMSERHREGLAHLVYGIRQPGGFVQLTGEVGTGKTTLCRCLLEQLPPEVTVALILNPRLSVVEFLATACDELRVAYPAGTTSIKVLVDSLHGCLLDAHARGRRCVLIVDEAQNLSVEVLEQVRLLTNLETATEKLLQIILIGQPELLRVLGQPQLRQLAQRITARYHLEPFSARETRAYIRHRLQVAGGSGALFTPAAMRWVCHLSDGVPRLINILCDRALLGAYAHDRTRVDARTVRRAGKEVRGESPRKGVGRRLVWALGLGAVGLAMVVLMVLGIPRHLSVPWSSGAVPAPGADVPALERADSDDATTRVSKVRDVRTVSKSAKPRSAAGPSLVDLLTAPSLPGDDHAAFASVFSRWQVEYRQAGNEQACDAGREAGLECLSRVGNWTKLRRFDLPAVLDLAAPAGERRRVALVALGEEDAILEIGGRAYRFPLDEIDRLWDGSFILVWKAPLIGSRVISRGMRGKDVEWLRRRLDALEGRAPKSHPSELYDAELERRVVAFQRSRSLIPDGLVGSETLTLLALAAREPDTPSLSRKTP
jgi:general secretion pathway protein A